MNEWIALDWGTSNFRAYLIRNRIILDKIVTNEGIKNIAINEFEKILKKNINKWIKCYSIELILASGMVGSNQGWIEVPYKSCPCSVIDLNYKRLKILNKIEVRILSGVSQRVPADVLRGEETQIAGYLLNNETFKGSICLPGTHSKWVNINEMKILNFQTFLTGELYELIKRFSILKHNLNSENFDPNIIISSAKKIINNPENFTNKLFNIRAESLLKKAKDIENNSKLTGYLLGLELAGSKTYWNNKNLIIIGSKYLIDLYSLILDKKCKSISLIKSDDMVISGLSFFKEKFYK